jgi:hypothetical protein
MLDSGISAVVLSSHVAGLGNLDVFARRAIKDSNGRAEPARAIEVDIQLGPLHRTLRGNALDAIFDGFDIDGLLPTGEFREVYICNTGKFVLFEPTHMPKPAPAWQGEAGSR